MISMQEVADKVRQDNQRRLAIVLKGPARDDPRATAAATKGLALRVLEGANKFASPSVPEDLSAVLLASTTAAVKSLACLVLGKKPPTGKTLTSCEQLLSAAQEEYVKIIYPEYPLRRVFIGQSVSAFGDWPGLLADIGRAARLAQVLGLPLEVLLAGPRWQMDNLSVWEALGHELLPGVPLTEEGIIANWEKNLFARLSLYESLGIKINFQDPGVTIPEQPLREMIGRLVDLGASMGEVEALKNGAVAPPGAAEADVAFLRHSAREKNRVDEDVVRYYLLLLIAQQPYLGNAIKVGPQTMEMFDRIHGYGLDFSPFGATSHLSAPNGPLGGIYEPQYRLGEGKRAREVLPYNPLSLDVIKSLKTGGDLSTLIQELIPLAGGEISTDEIATILKGTAPVIHLNRMMRDLTSFLLLCSRTSPDKLQEACMLSGSSGMEEIMKSVGGDDLQHSWQVETALLPGQPTRDKLLSWLDSVEKPTTQPAYTPLHLWFALQDAWGDEQLQGLAMIVRVARSFYRIVTHQ